MSQQIIHTSDNGVIRDLCTDLGSDNIVAIADTNTASIAHSLDVPVVTVEPGEEHKSIESASRIWDEFHRLGLTRHSVVVNVGGGMVTDLGGFAAATYRRGVQFINVPTTLLGAVDAACGGKTGINHCGVKNHVGVFAAAAAVVVNTDYFRTLPQEQLLSGYAEMLKHALLSGYDALKRVRQWNPRSPQWEMLPELVKESMEVKQRVVTLDPLEKGLRKALNLGHTAGHAFESHALEQGRPIPHGYAVAYGLVTALVLSAMKQEALNIRKDESGLLQMVASTVRELYGAPAIRCADYPRLMELMLDDKKNRHDGHVRFTLLARAGEPLTDVTTDTDAIGAALDITRDMLGI